MRSNGKTGTAGSNAAKLTQLTIPHQKKLKGKITFF